MINPIQITQPQAYSGGADFSPLAGLYDVYKKSQERAMQEQALGRLGDDPIANRQVLATSGVLPLARLGIGMQDTEIERRRADIAAAQAQQNWTAQNAIQQAQSTRAAEELKIRQAQESRAVKKDVEDTIEGRTAKLEALQVDPKDPNYENYRLTGDKPPTRIQQADEVRKKYEFEQMQKYDTREKRIAAAEAGGLPYKTDSELGQWVALGGDPPDKARSRLGIGGLTYGVDEKGNVRGYQLNSAGGMVEAKLPEGVTLLGPGQIAAAKAQGTATGKATGAAIVALPKLVDSATHQAQLLDEISAHPGRQWATGALSAVPDWALKGTPGAGFRQRFGQIKAQSFLGIYDQMRGAGQITNVEGDKGTSAVNRMDTASTEKEFDDAVKDLKGILKIGIERSQRAAKGDFSLHPKELQDLQTQLGVGAPGAPTAPAPTNTHKNIPFTFTP